jgi:hypothetical protein
MVPTAAGDGFTASQGALDAAGEAAETLWWFDSQTRTPSGSSGANGKGGGGVWRTRGEAVKPGAGVKTPAGDAHTNGGDDDDAAAPWTPWSALLDTSEAPYFRWYLGAKTNACFNAVDRHLLDGRGDDVAMTCLPEEDSQRFPPGAAAASARYSVTRRELAGATAAVQLRDVYKLQPRDRVLFHMAGLGKPLFTTPVIIVRPQNTS